MSEETEQKKAQKQTKAAERKRNDYYINQPDFGRQGHVQAASAAKQGDDRFCCDHSLYALLFCFTSDG